MKNLIKFGLLFTLFAGMLGKAQSASVGLAWDPNTETDLAGYKVYSGTASRNYTNVVTLGLVTSYTVTNVAYDITTFFTVTAYNTSNLESEYSNEVSALIPAPQPPPVPTSVAVVGRGRGKAGVQFNYASAVTASFRVYTNNVLMLSFPKPADGLVVIDLPGLLPSVLYNVQVSALGTNSLESAKSALVALKIPGPVTVRRN
jgi:hypothetical protein